jgi:hypothetical protein
MLENVHGNKALTHIHAFKCFTRFRDGQERHEDYLRSKQKAVA